MSLLEQPAVSETVVRAGNQRVETQVADEPVVEWRFDPATHYFRDGRPAQLLDREWPGRGLAFEVGPRAWRHHLLADREKMDRLLALEADIEAESIGA